MNERREPIVSRPQQKTIVTNTPRPGDTPEQLAARQEQAIRNKQSGFGGPGPAEVKWVDAPNIPAFILQREDREQLQPQPAAPLESVARQGMDALQMLVAERDKLRDDAAHWNGTAVRLSERVDHLETELRYFKARSEHYEKFSNAMVVQIQNLEMVIGDIKTRARNAAFSAEERPLSAAEENALSAIAQKFGANARPEENEV